jgi:hypothetical protein
VKPVRSGRLLVPTVGTVEAAADPERSLRVTTILGDMSCSWTGHLVHGPGSMIIATPRNEPLTCNVSEPPIGIEPMTYALRGACSPAADALAAPIARVIALTALVAQGLSGDPVHEPVHAEAVTFRFLLSVTALRALHPRSALS